MLGRIAPGSIRSQSRESWGFRELVGNRKQKTTQKEKGGKKQRQSLTEHSKYAQGRGLHSRKQVQDPSPTISRTH